MILSGLPRLKKSTRLNDPSCLAGAVILFLMICAGTLAYPSCIFGAKYDGIHVDQVRLDPAENTVRLYMSGESPPKAEEIRAAFGEEKIPLAPVGSWAPFDPTEGVFYIFLIDLSRPQPTEMGESEAMAETAKSAQNRAIREALEQFVSNSGKNDRIGLIAFGFEPPTLKKTRLLDEDRLSEIRMHEEILEEEILELDYGEGESAASSADFSDAIRAAIAMSNDDGRDSGIKRRVAAILSPNSVFAEDGDTEEIRKEIHASGLAFYGFGFEYRYDGGKRQKESSKRSLEAFSQFINNLQILGEGQGFFDHNTSDNFEYEPTLKDFRDYIQSFSVLTLKPGSGSDGSATSLPEKDAPRTDSLTGAGMLDIEWGEGEEAASIKIQYPGPDGALGEEENPSAETDGTTEDVSKAPSVFTLLFGGTDGLALLSPGLIIIVVILVLITAALILYLVWHFRDEGTGMAVKNGAQPAAVPPGALIRTISLIVTDERGETQRVKTTISGALFVGRDPANHLSFQDREMSQRHFSLTLEDGSFYIQDLRSANGTFVNGEPVNDRAFLRHNDVITAGQRKFVFKCDE